MSVEVIYPVVIILLRFVLHKLFLVSESGKHHASPHTACFYVAFYFYINIENCFSNYQAC